jgi:hypothetical protein
MMDLKESELCVLGKAIGFGMVYVAQQLIHSYVLFSFNAETAYNNTKEGKKDVQRKERLF